MKVMTVVGTRPELIKLSRIISELDRHFEHVFVHTGQNYDYELNEVFFEDLRIRKPDVFLGVVGKSVAETIGNIIAKTDAALEQHRPDAFLVYGDTNSGLSVIAAKRRKIPIFHMEAGNRCFDQRLPEEINRKIIDHVSDINMVLSEHARRYLLAEGIKADTIFKVGSTLKEVLNAYESQIEASTVLEKLQLSRGGFFVFSMHHEENLDYPENLAVLLKSMNQLAQEFKKRIIVSTHPRTRNRLATIGEASFDKLIEFHKPFGFFDYIKLQKEAACVVTDSGTITEESSLLGFPAVMIRQAHERPEGMDEGTVIMSGLEPESVCRAVRTTMEQMRILGRGPRLIGDYDVDIVSMKVVRLIMSYTGFVRRTVWHAK